MTKNAFRPPSFLQRAAATWVDFVFLLGSYLVLGSLTETLFDRDAYPRPTGMQIYSERDFAIFWFFVAATVVLTIIYLAISYGLFGATLGQKLARVRLLKADGSSLQFFNIFLRICTVLFRLFLIFIPGPIAAILFLAFTVNFLNPAFSMALLCFALLGLFYLSYVRYKNGDTRSFADYSSNTILIDLRPDKTNQPSEP